MNWALAALALSVLLFLPGMVELFEAPKSLAIRLLGTAAFAGWLAASSLRRRPWNPRMPSPLTMAVLIWLAMEALATAFSTAPRLSFFGALNQREGLLTSAALAMIYLAAREPLREPRVFARLTAVALGAVALSCLYAVLQVARLDPLPWGRTALYGGVLARPFGTLGHPNLLGVACAAAAAWAFAIALRDATRRWVAGPAAGLIVLAGALTFSRAAWLALAAGLAVILALDALQRRSLRPAATAALFGGIAALGVAALFALGGWGELFGTRAGELGRGGAETGGSRMEIWRAALAMWRDRPLFGHGPDTFEAVFPQFQTAAYWRIEWAGIPFHAHSTALHTLATRGAAGLAALAFGALAAFAAARRAWRAGGEPRARLVPLAGGAAAMLVAGSAGALGVTGALWIVLSAAALDAAAHGGRGRDTDHRPPAPRGARTWIRRATPWLLLAVLLPLAWREVQASREIHRARRSTATDPPAAHAAGVRAVRLGASDPEAWGALAEAQLAHAWSLRDTARLAQAERSAATALAHAPHLAVAWQRLGAVRAGRALVGDRGALPGMEDAYARALALAPMNALAMAELARWEILLGRPERALAPAERAVELYPDEAMLRTMLAAARVGSGDRDAARAELRRALAAEWRGRDDERRRAEDVLRALEQQGHVPRTR